MPAEIKVLHVQTKKTKDGKEYEIVHALVRIGNSDFVRKFYIFK